MTAQSVRFIQNDNIETIQLDDEWILLNLDRYTVTMINDTGGYFWSLLRKEQTTDSLYEAVVTEYGSDSSNEIDKQKIEGFLAELLACGVIQHVD